MSDEIETLRKQLHSGVWDSPHDDPLRSAERFIEKYGVLGALQMLLPRLPEHNDIAAFCVVPLEVDPADHGQPDANDVVGDYLEFDVDAPYIDKENWPQEVLLVGLSKEGRVAVTQTVNVMEFVEAFRPQWLEEAED